MTSTSEELGKPVHSDEKNHKVTYVTLVGMERAAREVQELSQKALRLLDGLEKQNDFLYDLIQMLVHRRK